MLTDINCSNECIYQKEGKCCFNSTANVIIKTNDICAYFMPKIEIKGERK